MFKRYKQLKRHPKKVSGPEIWVFTKKEFSLIIVSIIISSFISFIPKIPTNIIKILLTFLIFAIIIFTSIAVKKLVAPYYAIKIEHKIWELQRFGYYEKSYFKKPLPFGLILPFFLSILSFGYVKPFTFFQFDAENIPEKRLLKNRGRKSQRKETINESDLAYTSASGFYAIILLALIGLFIKFLGFGFGANLAKYSIYYNIWNMIPFSQLDGTKIFFGSVITWIFILIIQIFLLLIILFL